MNLKEFLKEEKPSIKFVSVFEGGLRTLSRVIYEYNPKDNLYYVTYARKSYTESDNYKEVELTKEEYAKLPNRLSIDKMVYLIYDNSGIDDVVLFSKDKIVVIESKETIKIYKRKQPSKAYSYDVDTYKACKTYVPKRKHTKKQAQPFHLNVEKMF